jgi:hypothetical protein
MKPTARTKPSLANTISTDVVALFQDDTFLGQFMQPNFGGQTGTITVIANPFRL